jgi:hypothetical protein
MKKLLLLLIVISIIVLPACSERLVRVKPYERESFAQEKMLYDPMEERTSYHEHIYSIREASQGGSSSFQGGCGCK